MSGRSPICRNALFVEELRQPHPEHALQEACAAIPLPREPIQAMPWRIERQSRVRILVATPATQGPQCCGSSIGVLATDAVLVAAADDGAEASPCRLEPQTEA